MLGLPTVLILLSTSCTISFEWVAQVRAESSWLVIGTGGTTTDDQGSKTTAVGERVPQDEIQMPVILQQYINETVRQIPELTRISDIP